MSRLSPINQARWARSPQPPRLLVAVDLLVLFTLSLAADLIANDKPLLVRYEGRLYLPFMISYSETAFGGELNTEADYQDPFVQRQIERHGWAVWAPIRFSYDTINFATEVPFPRHLPATTCWAPTATAATCWPGCCTVFASRCCSAGADAVFQPDRRASARRKGITAGVSICGGNALSKCGRACRRCF